VQGESLHGIPSMSEIYKYGSLRASNHFVFATAAKRRGATIYWL
jgi:hypothetical protein